MDLIADILLVSGALGAGFYCFILSRRLSRFNDLENGMGGAVAVLSGQVDDLQKAVAKSMTSATTEAERIQQLTQRAEDAAKNLELLLASMHDVPEPPKVANPSKPSEPIFSRSARG
ncbi:hypothetical protein ACS3SW_12420 [Roseobacteraceae bacterium S113]